METLILHQNKLSGNCYKVRLTASLLGKEFQTKEYDVLKGETRTEEFLKINTAGRVPVLQIGANTFLPESNSACYYIADGSRLIPKDRLQHAEMLRWMFFEQYQHEPNIAVLRYWFTFLSKESLNDLQKALIPGKVKAGEAALDVMDAHLSNRSYFVGEALTLADIALYAYTHVAGDAEFDLARWPNIAAWCKRIAAQPSYVSLADG